MATDNPSLGTRAFVHAVRQTLNAYKKNIEGLGGQAVITVFTLAITAAVNGGVRAVLTDLSTLGIVAAANAGWVLLLFLWHLWLAPYELSHEAVQKAQRPGPAAAAPPQTKAIDQELAGLVGKVRFLERAILTVKYGSNFSIYLRDLEESIHIFWGDTTATNLRLNFIASVKRARMLPGDVQAATLVQQRADFLTAALLKAAKRED